jgi:hypothetical protein
MLGHGDGFHFDTTVASAGQSLNDDAHRRCPGHP